MGKTKPKAKAGNRGAGAGKEEGGGGGERRRAAPSGGKRRPKSGAHSGCRGWAAGGLRASRVCRCACLLRAGQVAAGGLSRAPLPPPRRVQPTAVRQPTSHRRRCAALQACTTTQPTRTTWRGSWRRWACASRRWPPTATASSGEHPVQRLQRERACSARALHGTLAACPAAAATPAGPSPRRCAAGPWPIRPRRAGRGAGCCGGDLWEQGHGSRLLPPAAAPATPLPTPSCACATCPLKAGRRRRPPGAAGASG